MNINRDNYETYFLMYVDHELSAAERQAVEVFIQEHTDLAAELQLLQETVLPGDAIWFDDKKSLLKEECTALQENLLLYMDGELDAAATSSTEQLLKTDAAAAKEFALLQHTQLDPADTIAFPNKNILYRKEPAKVVAFNWRRIAIAAILLGFGTWGTVAYLQNSNKPADHGVATTAETGTPKTAAPAGTIKQDVITADVHPSTALPSENPASAATTEANSSSAAQKNNTIQPAVKKPANIPATHTLELPQDNNAVAQKTELKKPSNNLPKPDYNNFNKELRNINTDVAVTPVNRPNVDAGSATTAQPVNHTNDTEVTGYALNTKYDETNAEQEDNTNKKSKLGSLFRKVKRMVERTTNTPSGNGVKIATFDIAIK